MKQRRSLGAAMILAICVCLGAQAWAIPDCPHRIGGSGRRRNRYPRLQGCALRSPTGRPSTVASAGTRHALDGPAGRDEVRRRLYAKAARRQPDPRGERRLPDIEYLGAGADPSGRPARDGLGLPRRFRRGLRELPLYDGEALARKGLVLVSLNYRTGVFGFLAHRALAAESPQRSAGNYGILDVIEALRWIKRNIGAFGGDPNRVTVFGESAGASMLDMVLISPLSEGLVQGAILESPGAMRPLSSLEMAEKIANVADFDLAALRAMPATEVLALNGKIVPPVRRLTSPRALGPI
jgi:hypothetical protein